MVPLHSKSSEPNSIKEVFKNTKLGPTREADNVAQAWLDDHERSFGHFIDGKWVKPEGRKTYQTKNPATGQTLASTLQGTKEDVDMAVKSSRKAYESWSKTPPHVRARYMYSVARHIQKHQRLITVVESMDNGKTFRESRDADIPTVVRHWYHHAGWAQLMESEMRGWQSIGVLEPLVGQTLRRLIAGTGKKLSLELGGKSAVIVFDSADLDSTVEGLVDAIWFNQGQVCSAGSRLLVQESVYGRLVGKLKTRLTHFRVGDSLDKTVDMGAIVDDSQKKSIDEYVEDARREGAEVYQASACIPVRGCFYPPTLITNVQTVSRVVAEEIFGPVLVVLPFRTAKEAITLANNSMYGLGGSVWTENISLAMEVAISIKTGTMWINSHNMFDAAAGFGGYKQSGYGRDGGKEGLYEYVRPAWESRPRPANVELDLKTFGATIGSRPNVGGNECGKGEIPKIDHTYKMYYGGAQKRPDGQYSRPVTNPDGKVIGHVGEGNRKDIRNAVEAAHSAAPGWGKRAAHNRAQIVYYMAENLEIRKQEFAGRIQEMTGKSLEEALREVDVSINRLFHWGAYCDKYGGSVQETTLYGATVKIHEPVGVIGIACPDQYPLLAFVSLFAPAVIRGNTVVIVPSEKYPLLALDLYQIFDTSDLPGGVVNIITGDRDHLTKFLAEHQDIQSMWYFGGAEGSKYVEYISAENVKRTWVNYGIERDWEDCEQGQGEEFLYHSIQVKNIWIPMGDVFAN
ncbi:LOW QUALITY PROTEIN: aldehyde dehydrogenase family 16 member A1-like [Ruditapes philippinarum]|uniref:LOW QUALITY PROTEIN: aldehyde dehydrogenase family 16 member A1-like n=1 Tax=Ruditapes philippinarum TaxID=129788 RepID=UPI00295BEFC7|nr:LOW QUALITY PROTEIN: aldehyde dehydrogenase family 16 member A1-like [Ruditapes philippinarum]